MQLHILGSGGYYPSSKRHTLCSVIPEVGLILDAGTGFFRLDRFLDDRPWNIFLTHAHLDHVIGLTYYWGLTQQRDVGPITVRGSENTLRAVKELLFSDPLFPKMPPYHFVPIGSHESFSVNLERDGYDPISVVPVPLSHPGGAMGYRFGIAGRSIAYITDTTLEAASAYLKVIRNVDVLIHEAFYPAGYEEMAQRTGHVTIRQAVQVAQSAGAKRLIIVHVNPVIDFDHDDQREGVAATFPEVIVASDNLVVEI